LWDNSTLCFLSAR